MKHPFAWLELKGAIDLDGVFMFNDQEYGVLDLSAFTNHRRFLNHLDVPAGIRNWKITGQVNQLFDVTQSNVLGVFLLHTPNALFQNDVFSGKKITAELVALMKRCIIDYIFVRDENGLEVDPKNLLKSTFELRDVQFLTKNNDDRLSISNCGEEKRSADFLAYRYGWRSPGE